MKWRLLASARVVAPVTSVRAGVQANGENARPRAEAGESRPARPAAGRNAAETQAAAGPAPARAAPPRRLRRHQVHQPVAGEELGAAQELARRDVVDGLPQALAAAPQRRSGRGGAHGAGCAWRRSAAAAGRRRPPAGGAGRALPTVGHDVARARQLDRDGAGEDQLAHRRAEQMRGSSTAGSGG